VDHRHIWHWTKARREEELAKCEVLCDVCHNAMRWWSNLLQTGWTGIRVT
jgi:hypothetical protein